MEKLDVKPHGNANDLCLVCHRKLDLMLPSQAEKESQCKFLNEKYKMTLIPSDIVFVSKRCPCGQDEQVFYKNFAQEWQSLI